MNQHQTDLWFCHKLGDRYKPWAIIDGKELVSFPWPENGRIYLNARTVPGDPTTMLRYRLANGRLVEDPA